MLFPPPDRDENERMNLEWLELSADSEPIRYLLNGSILRALQDGADIHLQLRRDICVLILETDKKEEETIPHEEVVPLIARLKIMAGLDPTKTHQRQKGKIELNIAENRICAEVAFDPVLLGEEFSMRLVRQPRIDPASHDRP